MLREQSGPETAGERYNAISSFLSATEDYLHRLAGKVASVRLAQEASEAAATAMSEARSQGGHPFHFMHPAALLVSHQSSTHTVDGCDWYGLITNQLPVGLCVIDD